MYICRGSYVTAKKVFIDADRQTDRQANRQTEALNIDNKDNVCFIPILIPHYIAAADRAQPPICAESRGATLNMR